MSNLFLFARTHTNDLIRNFFLDPVVCVFGAWVSFYHSIPSELSSCRRDGKQVWLLLLIFYSHCNRCASLLCHYFLNQKMDLAEAGVFSAATHPSAYLNRVTAITIPIVPTERMKTTKNAVSECIYSTSLYFLYIFGHLMMIMSLFPTVIYIEGQF